MKLNVFGRLVEVARDGTSWKAFYLGNEGKRRLAEDIIIPPHIQEEQIIEYVADLCHEWATPNRNEVRKL